MTLLRYRWGAAAIAFAALVVVAEARAQNIGEIVTVTGVIGENLVAAGRSVNVDADVDGDVVGAGQNVDVGGRVRGDVLAVAETVRARGEIEGDVRIAGRFVEIDASVAGDVMAAGAQVSIVEGAAVGGRAWLAGDDVTVAGTVGRELRIGARTATISGAVDGDAIVWAEEIRIESGAHIAGDFTYRSLDEADIDPASRIDGDVTFIRSERPRRAAGSVLAAAVGVGLVTAAGLFVLGIAQVLLAPGLMLGAARTLRASKLKSLAVGAAVFLSAPFALILLAVSIVGVPLLIVTVAAYVVALATALFVASLAIGGRALRVFGGGAGATHASRIGTLAVGILILFVVGWIPLLGALAGLVALILGLGAVLIEARRRGARPSVT